MCSVAVILLNSDPIRKSKRRLYLKKALLIDFRMEDASSFINFTRMSPCDFEFLINLFGLVLLADIFYFSKVYHSCIKISFYFRCFGY